MQLSLVITPLSPVCRLAIHFVWRCCKVELHILQGQSIGGNTSSAAMHSRHQPIFKTVRLECFEAN